MKVALATGLDSDLETADLQKTVTRKSLQAKGDELKQLTRCCIAKAFPKDERCSYLTDSYLDSNQPADQ